MDFFVHIEGRRLRVSVANGGCTVDGEPVELELAPPNGTPVRTARAGGRSLRVRPRRNGRGDWTLEVEGARYRAEVLDPGQEAVRKARRAAGALAGPPPLKAPMPGLVVRVEVAVGDVVARGQGVVIVEAMKMENELHAPGPARVKTVHVEAGTAVEKDAVLVEFEPLESEGAGSDASGGGRGGVGR
jgi:biotin carboxyl carrier protein